MPQTRVPPLDRPRSPGSYRQGHPFPLPAGARVAVVGGGPAGSFFALQLLRKARRRGRTVEVVILERKKELGSLSAAFAIAPREGCNYCAGGISPRMNDVLADLGIDLPEEIVQSRITSIMVQGHWKNIELPVPRPRQMLSIYRGAQPRTRLDPRMGFDSFLMEKAVHEGASVITGEVREIARGSDGKLAVTYSSPAGTTTLASDFVAVAAGVNRTPGMRLEDGELHRSLKGLIDGYQPPAVRKTLIGELEVDPYFLESMRGELFFIEYGSPQLHIEMCSLIPKGRQFITLVLIGRSIDETREPEELYELVQRFLALPQVRKIVPREARLCCLCRPNMVIDTCPAAYGERVALIGDSVTSRLYKDGILSAYMTATSLANAILRTGIDRRSLKQAYGPTIREFILDNRFGKLVFLLQRATFQHPVTSRILYQAILTERKTKREDTRTLERILWKIASGDDHYRDIFWAMMHPLTLWLIGTGGLLITLRNWLTELFFGLNWRGFGRFTTGISREDYEAKRNYFRQKVIRSGLSLPQLLEFERIYTIRIKAAPGTILKILGTFGDEDRDFFKPRMVKVKRIQGEPNAEGTVIQYEILSKFFTFKLAIEHADPQNSLIYRIISGFPRGGALIFSIDPDARQHSMLSIYVAFNFPRGKHLPARLTWSLFRLFFPAYMHDVIWNHSLCKIKDIAESLDSANSESRTPIQPKFQS